MSTTGVIGLGAMGAPMALNLERAGRLAAVWNRTPGRIPAALPPQRAADSPADLAGRCRVVLLSVSRDADLLEVITALAPGLTPGSTVIDTSTVAAATAVEAARLVGERQGDFLDCPVSGGVEGAKHGSLSVMAGGDTVVLERVRPVLACIAGKVTHIGPVGSGQAAKAVNQLMAAGINHAVTEALAFGSALGLDMEPVRAAVSSGAAANWFLEHRGESMLRGDFRPGFKLELHYKDLEIVRAMARDCRLPMLARTLQDYRRLIEAGEGGQDISVLYKSKAGDQV